MSYPGMMLHLKPENDNVLMMYIDHNTYHSGDSGLDLFFPEDINILPKETVTIDLQIQCEGLKDVSDPVSDSDSDSETESDVRNISYYLYPRSSISKTPLRMANSVGIIDAGYRGNIKVAVDNISDKGYTVSKGQRLFQICAPDLGPIDLKLADELSTSSRGPCGFGSTGGTGMSVQT